MIGSEEPQLLQVPIGNSPKFKLNIKSTKDKKFYSKLDEQLENNIFKNKSLSKKNGKYVKPKSSSQSAFDGIPKNVCDSIHISFEDLEDCHSLPSGKFSDIPSDIFEDIEVAVQEN